MVFKLNFNQDSIDAVFRWAIVNNYKIVCLKTNSRNKLLENLEFLQTKAISKQYFSCIIFTAFKGNILDYKDRYVLLSNCHASEVVNQTWFWSHISIIILLNKMDIEEIIISMKLFSKKNEKRKHIKQDHLLQKLCNK